VGIRKATFALALLLGAVPAPLGASQIVARPFVGVTLISRQES